MVDASARLALPYIQPSQAQKHVTHNEALLRLDALAQLSVVGIDATTPPIAPQDGDTYSIGSSPGGAWTGQAGQLAYWQTAGWLFIAPQEGWRAWSAADATIFVYSNESWVAVGGPLQNIDGLGIGTTSDATNRLALISDASLFNHAGSGHQIKVNKAAATDTASLLFQTGFSGRAEMGLTGSDAFEIKVSADGATWDNAVLLNPATQTITFSTAGTAKLTCTPTALELHGTVTGDAIQSNPMDETPARLMPVGAFGLGTYGSAEGRISDGQSPLPSGFYEGNGGTANTATFPNSISRYGPILNLVRSTSDNIVRAFFDNARPIICRSNDGAATWEEPNFLYGTEDILGPVSQNAGQPTGAIIDRGSNANGAYVRFADGTAMATRTVTINGLAITGAEGVLYASTPLNFTLPITFSTVDHVSANLKGSDNSTLRDAVVSVRLGRGAGAIAGTWDGMSVMATQSTTALAGEATHITLFATGRWI